MIYAKVENNWPVQYAPEEFPGYTTVFSSEDELADYMARFDAYRPRTIYVRVVDRWPVEMRDSDWPGRTHTFTSLGACLEYRNANLDAMPAPSQSSSKTDGEVWAEKLADGWVDPITGIKLKTTEGARNLFSGQMTKAFYKIQKGELSGSEKTGLWDFDDNPRYMTYDALIELLVRYGDAWEQMFVQYAP